MVMKIYQVGVLVLIIYAETTKSSTDSLILESYTKTKPPLVNFTTSAITYNTTEQELQGSGSVNSGISDGVNYFAVGSETGSTRIVDKVENSTITKVENRTDEKNTLTALTTPSLTSPHSAFQEKDQEDSLLEELPRTCINRQKLNDQPIQDEYSKIKRCCPHGESLYGNNGKYYCDDTETTNEIQIEVIDVVLYEKCIEDTEKKIQLENQTGNPCNISFIYGIENGDILYIIQNGSLLILDENRNESYQIEDDYCLDVNHGTGELYAAVCVNAVNSHISKGQTILFTIFMVCSIPCLIFVSYIHFAIKELRTLHGLTLGSLSGCLAIGFFLHSIAQLFETVNHTKMGYAVQYFILSYFFWLFILCVNVTITVWIFIPRYVLLPKKIRYARFGIYFGIATIIPLILVLVTKSKGLDGMPSYFYQGWSASIRTSQRYFIPPVTIILVFCAIMLITTHFGYQKIDNMTNLQNIDLEMFRETKKDFKCITYLTIIIITTWTFEVATFYLPGVEDHLVMMEIINGLQGVFILMIFIGLRHRRYIIVRWWHDRGSLDTDIEMRNLNLKK